MIEFDLESFVGQHKLEQLYMSKEDRKIIQSDMPERTVIEEEFKINSEDILL